ncbi:uncharacterized protein LOC135849197 isoform X2 [Planococcus citri]|uniref:uncharacterized protein LOC135849197 isoform X2 n=1 Tax=Planococcus citri TaxID=170843 RepID=UPI0031F88994
MKIGNSELKISELYFKVEVILGQQVSSDEQQRKKEAKRPVCTEAEQLLDIVSDSGEDYTEFPLTDDQRKLFSDALKSDLLHRYNYVGGPYCTFKSIEEVREDAREIIKILPLGMKARAELGFSGKRDY